jgi:hypothetical protein
MRSGTLERGLMSPLVEFVDQFAVSNLTYSIIRFECGEQDAGLRQVEAGRALGTLTRNPMIGWMAALLHRGRRA